MEWLQFADFHFGRKRSAQSDAMSALVEFVSIELKNNPNKIDAIFLLGDIAYSGQEIEYLNFENDFLKPLLNIDKIKGAKIFAVPGNHDVDCEATTPITWEGIRERNQSIYFCEDEEGQKVRKHRSVVFQNYQNFIERNNIISPNPFKEVSIFRMESDFPFDIFLINTSFFCDRDEQSDQPIIPCPLSALRARLHNQERVRPLFIIGHHPQKCFLKEHQQSFESFLIDKQAVYLHGHEHDPKFSSNTDGTLRTLGFGAAHIASLDEQTQAPYRNCFTRCWIDTKMRLLAYSWDSHVGRWLNTTNVQFSSCFSTTNINPSEAIFNIPLLTKINIAESPSKILRNIPRKSPHPQGIIPLSVLDENVWLQLLPLSININKYYKRDRTKKIHSFLSDDGKVEITLETDDKRDLVICIQGTTHILTIKEIESFNTRLDTEDYRSVTILSLGKMSGDAEGLYSRLRAKKLIEVMDNLEITRRWQHLLSITQADFLSNLDAGTHIANIILHNNDQYLLIINSGNKEENINFYIIDSKGNTIKPIHTIVTTLRDAIPKFSKMKYFGEYSTDNDLPELLNFNESDYLKQCYAEYNAIKYAALANIGIRFSDFSLEDVYIDASACERETAQSNRIDNLLEDHLAAYPASEKLKAQIKQQFHNQLTGHEGQNIAHAREFCQKFTAVLLTGDPGSGKTCFVKSEILAYCKRVVANTSKISGIDEWHSLHIPIMVSLSQAAAEADLEKIGLLEIASRLLQRRGFSLMPEKLRDILKEGKLALFFDGLDEVVSIEKRALVVQCINDIVIQAQPLGNRIIVTSRPAAVNVVNLLPSLRRLELQGLSQNEIRILAMRILNLKFSETTDDGLIVDIKEPQQSDNSIIKQLLSDIAEKPGVARFASNPLLLTLLVMIYANSGAPSAKRHKVYEEAIKTLASVRGRQAGHIPVSVQDLRERLGAVALSVYRKESGLLPTQKEVTEIVRLTMGKQSAREVPKIDAQRFIQKVAESTGLIALGNSESTCDDTNTVTFMHHSFMEYFAAVGLSRELKKTKIKELVTLPRWMEILTLLSGIIGENEDIAPILAQFIGEEGSDFGEVDARYLIFSLDCALECEVPSEAAIRLLLIAIANCIEKGPARTDPWVRSEIGQRLAQLVASCGLASFEESISSLILNSDPTVCGAAIILAGYACIDESESKIILRALEDSTSRTDEVVLSALCDTVGRLKWARTPALKQVVFRCLKKSERCKRAAYEAILAIPGMAPDCWSEIINGLDDTSISIRQLASKVAIVAGLDGDVAALNDARKDLVANAMRIVNETFGENEYFENKVKDETIDRLLRSYSLRDRLVGIQLIPMAQNRAVDAYSRLMEILKGTTDREEVTAVLHTLRFSSQARLLFTVADAKYVVKLIDEGTADVRKACILLLGYFGNSPHAIRPLIDRDLSKISTIEYATIFGALGRAQVLQPEIIQIVEKEILNKTSDTVRFNEEYVTKICALLDATRCQALNLRSNVSTAIRDLICDYKQDKRVNGMALRAFAASTIPSKPVVDFLIQLYKNPPSDLLMELSQSLGVFAKNCRQSVVYVMACIQSMADLRAAAISLHNKISKRDVSTNNEFMITGLRDGIREISEIIVTFEEFNLHT